MATRPKQAPKFGRGDIVVLSLFDQEGKPKNGLAQEAQEYYSQSAVVVTLGVTSGKSNDVFVYGVQMDDGNVLELTEVCLMPLLSF